MVSFSSSSAQNGGLGSSVAAYDAEYWFGFQGQEKDDEIIEHRALKGCLLIARN